MSIRSEKCVQMPLPPGSSANIDLSREVMAVEPALREVGDDSKRSRTFNVGVLGTCRFTMFFPGLRSASMSG